MDSAPPNARNERIAILLICLLGAAHVFIFSAAFPFFQVVDEQVHVDLVIRYSHGDIPRTLTPVYPETLPFLAIYGTPEYLTPIAMESNGVPPPPWKQSPDSVRDKLMAKEAAYQQVFKNQEAASPPLYYSLAGAWWRIGKWLGFDGEPLLYWARFLNVPLVALLIWLSWLATRSIFPDNRFVCLAVPLLIALLPQAVFYAINSDVLTPLTFGAAFMLLLKFFDVEKPSFLLAVATGLALAAAYLTKATNLPLIACAVVFIGLRTLVRTWQRELRPLFLPLLILLATAAVPMAAWMVWCKTNFGDITGTGAKVQFFGWTPNPRAFWLSHPIFTGHGLWYFVKANLATFWQGELMWHRQPLTYPDVDAAYVVLTLGIFALTLAALFRRPSPFTSHQIWALCWSFLCVAAALAFLGMCSVKYDFHDFFNPSRANPFFVSGRLMLGMLVPFMILFAYGLDRLLRQFGASKKFFVLFLLLGFMVLCEIATDWPLFSSEYNWFHM